MSYVQSDGRTTVVASSSATVGEDFQGSLIVGLVKSHPNAEYSFPIPIKRNFVESGMFNCESTKRKTSSGRQAGEQRALRR